MACHIQYNILQRTFCKSILIRPSAKCINVNLNVRTPLCSNVLLRFILQGHDCSNVVLVKQSKLE